MRDHVMCFGVRVTGNDHLDRNLPCQDFCKCERLDNGWLIAAVADGVGSAKHSEKGSRLAVETAIDFCRENFPFDGVVSSMKAMIAMAYNKAMREIIKLARAEGNAVEDYDTTLTLVIYSGRRILYGHVGDSGMIGLTTAGEYELITTPQKGEDGFGMIPLRFGAKEWVIGSSEEEYAAVLLATDGLLENLFMPAILKLQEQHLNVYELRKLMDKNYNHLNEKVLEHFQKQVGDVLSDPEQFKYITGDDKTVVVLISNQVQAEQMEEAYYREPDWKALEQKRKKLLYEEPKEAAEPGEGTVRENSRKTSKIKGAIEENETQEKKKKRKRGLTLMFRF